MPIGTVALGARLVLRPYACACARLRETFDFAGAFILGVGLLAFALALTVGQNVGFASPPILGLFVAFLVAVPLFIWAERRVRYPMVDLSLFSEPQFSLNLFTGWLTFVAIAGIVFLLPFYLELVIGLSLRDVGLMMAVMPIINGIHPTLCRLAVGPPGYAPRQHGGARRHQSSDMWQWLPLPRGNACLVLCCDCYQLP